MKIMQKLTLEHLAGYLPYGLNGMHEGKRIDFNTDNIYTFILNAKPILRPLSDLTKEIEVGGEKFVPIYKLAENDYYIKSLRDNIANVQHLKNHYFFNSFLFEWHFDIHNLISEGLAIDINTLK